MGVVRRAEADFLAGSAAGSEWRLSFGVAGEGEVRVGRQSSACARASARFSPSGLALPAGLQDREALFRIEVLDPERRLGRAFPRASARRLAAKEELIAKNYQDAGLSKNYVMAGPNSNTYVRYQLTKAGCVPPLVPDAPGY